MTKEQLIIRLGGIEWDDFEAKTAKSELPKNIWVQKNPGGFIVPVSKVLQEAISLPRNPIIIKLFRFAKLSENAGYGIDKMKRWTTLTGKNVGFRSDVTHATVTYFKKFDINDGVNEPVNDGVNNHKNDGVNEPINKNANAYVSGNYINDNSLNDGVNDSLNDGVNDGVNDPVNGDDLLTQTEKAILLMMSTDTPVTYVNLQNAFKLSEPTIRRTLKKLRQYGLLIREGSDKTGRWIVTEKGQKVVKNKKRKS